jgi:hypothetical protein
LRFIVVLPDWSGAARRTRWAYCATDDAFKSLIRLNWALNVLKPPSEGHQGGFFRMMLVAIVTIEARSLS